MTTNSGGPPNTIGGRETPTLTLTLAIAGIGNTSTNAKNNVPKSNFFILLSPLHITVLSILKSFCFPQPATQHCPPARLLLSL
jgi:hypothetical protein